MRVYIAILVFIVVLTGCDTSSTEYKPNRFDQDNWLNGDRLTKGTMADDIIKDSLLIGKTNNQVMMLLGLPEDSTENGSRYYWTIDIGKKTGSLGLGGPWLFQLNVDFDTIHNTVQQAWIAD